MFVICQSNIYVYKICLLINKFLSLLFVYQLKSLTAGHKFLVIKKQLTSSYKMRGILYLDDQWINSYHNVSFSYNTRNLVVNYADFMRKN